MAKHPHGTSLPRPAYEKTPFGATPAVSQKKPTPGATNQMLPGRKALKQLAKPGSNGIQNFGRLTPLGSGALDQDFLSEADRMSKRAGGF